MMELEGRVALVTGASGGIGAAASNALAKAGAKVILADLAEDHDQAAAIDGIACKLDVTSEADWQAAIELARQEAGGLDILVNNAGLFLMKPVTETSLEEWRRVQSVNVEGTFLGCKHAVPLLAERAGDWEGGASIINMSSTSGLVGSTGTACYNATKGAIRLMSKSLAIELARQKIRVNSLHPGPTETDMGDAVVNGISGIYNIDDDKALTAVLRSMPLGHFGTPQNIADAVLFLASDKAGFMTGSELVVDGGITAQ